MIEGLIEFSALSAALIWQFGLVFLRVGAMVSLLPAFGEQTVPMRIKLAVALVFTLIVAPAAPTAAIPDGTAALAWAALTESLIGFALGIGLRLFVFALQTAGTIAAQSVSLSQILGGAGIEPIPALGYVMVISGLALAVILGLHVRAAEFLIRSYDLFPFGQFPNAGMLSEWGLSQVARSFTLAFMLAIPFVLGSMLYNITLGVINRAMPQLMVAFVGAPVITLGGMLILFLCLPFMLSVWSDALLDFLSNPFGG
ncbi:MAG: flagellar biosynthetic protein FliR [Pseudomonadota bacterium]